MLPLGSMRTRTLVLYAALCGASACVAGPIEPILQTPVTGDWTGTFESSWGTLPIKATFANERYTQSISGTYALDGNRATGTIGGTMQTRERDIPGFLIGSMDISFELPDGQRCRSFSAPVVGSATSRSFTIDSTDFRHGNCPDPPSTMRITLTRVR